LAATINGRIFAVHGGLSPSIHLLDQLSAIDRFQDPVTEGPLTDLLWADPFEGMSGFRASKRGLGYLFGGDVTQKFILLNRLTHVTRAHQLAMKGYEVHFGGLASTVWSAPNYMYRSGNLASVMRVSHNEKDFSLWFNIFDAVPGRERTVPAAADVVAPYFT
jgi:diadenosine tetraphosphatase ApaH/serine/threonine PP2A family protein phosphatase